MLHTNHTFECFVHEPMQRAFHWWARILRAHCPPEASLLCAFCAAAAPLLLRCCCAPGALLLGRCCPL